MACLDHGSDWLARTRADLGVNRARLESSLPELEAGVALAPGVPGLIAWIEDEGSDRFARLLRRARIDLLPAGHYGDAVEPGWRISYGVHPDILAVVIDRLRQARHSP